VLRRSSAARVAPVGAALLCLAPAAAGAQNVWAPVTRIDTVAIDYWPPSLKRTKEGPIAVWLRLTHDSGLRMVRHTFVYCGKSTVQLRPIAADLYDQTGRFLLSTGMVTVPWSMAEAERVNDRIGLYVCRFLTERATDGEPVWRVTPAEPPPRWREFYRDARQSLKLDMQSLARTDSMVAGWARWEFSGAAEPTPQGPANAFVYKYEAFCATGWMRMRSFAAYDSAGQALPASAREMVGAPEQPPPGSSAFRIRRALCEESLSPWTPPETPWGPPPG
jgi:hypothetical protein